MTINGHVGPQPPGTSENPAQAPADRRFWLKVRNRILEGLVVILPVLITFWVIHWLYRALELYAINPLTVFVIWKVQQLQSAPELPYWFETFVAPVLAILLALVILYCCGVLAASQLRRLIDQFFLRVPMVSQIYNAALGVLQCFEKPKGQPAPQRIVLIPFPHAGTRLPAVVTSTCRDISTNKTLLCVYVPTTPVPASGFFLMIPEEDAVELNWDVQQTLQTIISGGLTAPPEVSYYKLSAAVPPEAPRDVSKSAV